MKNLKKVGAEPELNEQSRFIASMTCTKCGTTAIIDFNAYTQEDAEKIARQKCYMAHPDGTDNNAEIEERDRVICSHQMTLNSVTIIGEAVTTDLINSYQFSF